MQLHHGSDLAAFNIFSRSKPSVSYRMVSSTGQEFVMLEIPAAPSAHPAQ